MPHTIFIFLVADADRTRTRLKRAMQREKNYFKIKTHPFSNERYKNKETKTRVHTKIVNFSLSFLQIF